MSFAFYCGCGFRTNGNDALEHTPEPGNCCNCSGRKCMDCVLRIWHDDCEDSCPDCCN